MMFYFRNIIVLFWDRSQETDFTSVTQYLSDAVQNLARGDAASFLQPSLLHFFLTFFAMVAPSKFKISTSNQTTPPVQSINVKRHHYCFM